MINELNTGVRPESGFAQSERGGVDGRQRRSGSTAIRTESRTESRQADRKAGTLGSDAEAANDSNDGRLDGPAKLQIRRETINTPTEALTSAARAFHEPRAFKPSKQFVCFSLTVFFQFCNRRFFQPVDRTPVKYIAIAPVSLTVYQQVAFYMPAQGLGGSCANIPFRVAVCQECTGKGADCCPVL